MNRFSRSIPVLNCYVSAAFMPTVAAAGWSTVGLGILDGTDSSYVYGINDSGQVVGVSEAFGYHGFLYSDGMMLDISSLLGVVESGWGTYSLCHQQ